MKLISDSVALLLNITDKKELLGQILSNPDDFEDNLIRLSSICKVKITFKSPQNIHIGKSKTKEVTEHTFNILVREDDIIYYKIRSNGKNRYILPLSEIEMCEPVVNTVDEFLCYDAFRKMFDPRFITEKEIERLWKMGSVQHPGKYKPSDFKTICPIGKAALKRFLVAFKDVESTDTDGYKSYEALGSSAYLRMIEEFHKGTDISVSHFMGSDTVTYSKTSSDTGTGFFGILANKNQYLWQEE